MKKKKLRKKFPYLLCDLIFYLGYTFLMVVLLFMFLFVVKQIKDYQHKQDDTPACYILEPVKSEYKKTNISKEEILQKDNIVEKEVEEEIKSIKNNYVEVDAIVSYYTYLPSSTGSGDGITATGKKVTNSSLAIPRNDELLKYGTKVEFEFLAPQYMKDYNGQYLTRIADDTGSPKHIRKVDENTYRVDVFCSRLENETDTQYHNRVYSYGKTKTKMKIYN